MPMGDKLIELWKSSALIQGTMALTGFFVISYLTIVGQLAPEVLASLVGTIVGYYFGTKKRQGGG